MRDNQLERMTVAELKELSTRVDKTIANRMTTERNELRDKFKALADEAGLSLDEIVGGSGRSGKKRGTASAKFANPSNSTETWSGRGRQPKWLSSRLMSGANLEEFRI